MKAFVGEVDLAGLRRLIPEDLLSPDELARLARQRPSCPRTIVRALLADRDVEDLRAELGAGRHRAACGLLLNRAVELLALGSALSGVAPAA